MSDSHFVKSDFSEEAGLGIVESDDSVGTVDSFFVYDGVVVVEVDGHEVSLQVGDHQTLSRTVHVSLHQWTVLSI